jgi:hypothetical protein
MAEAIALISSVVLQGVLTTSGRSDTSFKTLHAVKLLIFRKSISVEVRRFLPTFYCLISELRNTYFEIAIEITKTMPLRSQLLFRDGSILFNKGKPIKTLNFWGQRLL